MERFQVIDYLSDRIKWQVVRGTKEQERIQLEIETEKSQRCRQLVKLALQFLTIKKAMSVFREMKEIRKHQHDTIFIVNFIKMRMMNKLQKLKPTVN
jgi:hypothetical protein